MVNPRISRDGKYPKNLENWEILGNKNSYKKINYIFFCFSLKEYFKLYMLYMLLHPLRFAIK